jgi:hypothetical protein
MSNWYLKHNVSRPKTQFLLWASSYWQNCSWFPYSVSFTNKQPVLGEGWTFYLIANEWRRSSHALKAPSPGADWWFGLLVRSHFCCVGAVIRASEGEEERGSTLFFHYLDIFRTSGQEWMCFYEYNEIIINPRLSLVSKWHPNLRDLVWNS